LTTLESRLRSAVQAVASANTKLQDADKSIALLTKTIEDLPQHAGAVNSLATADAQAFEAWARAADDSEPPQIDAAAHDAARVALAGAQAKAAAATSALRKIEAERMQARTYGEAAQAAIEPLAAQIAIAKRVPELLAEAAELWTQVWHKQAQLEEAHPLLISVADRLPKGSQEAREVYEFASRLFDEIRQHGRGGKPADAVAIRAEWFKEINATIDAHANNETEK
jgi:chromosome segregation ATPase